MADAYRPLPHHPLNQPVIVMTPPEGHSAAVSEQSPAITAMTDLSHIRPLMIDPFASMNDANEKMIAYAVRMLFVAPSGQEMIGIITAADILSEKPVQYMREVNCAPGEVLVRDIMTPVAGLEVLRLDDVERARIGDIIETLRHSGKQHALVVQLGADGRETVCGILSTSQISRLMNARVEVAEVATNFAAIQSALS